MLLIPVTARTAENASNTGRPAAISAPKAIRRIAIVRGSDVSSALPMSRSMRLLIAYSDEAWPNSSMITLGLPACTRSTAARIGAILSCAFSALPLTSNWTRIECRSLEISPAAGWSIGETMLVTFGSSESVCTSPATAALNGSSLTVQVRVCTSTLSRAGILKLP